MAKPKVNPARRRAAAVGPALVRAKTVPAIRIDPRAIAVPSWLAASCAVPAGDGRIAAAGDGVVELYATKKLLAAIECPGVEVVAAVHGGRVVVAATRRGGLVVFGVRDDTFVELGTVKGTIDGRSLSTAGDRVFARRKSGLAELVGLLPTYAGLVASGPDPVTIAPSGFVLRPIAAKAVPADTRDPGDDWADRAGRTSPMRADAVAIHPDGNAAIVCDPTGLWWVPRAGKGKQIAKLEPCGSIVGAEFIDVDPSRRRGARSGAKRSIDVDPSRRRGARSGAKRSIDAGGVVMLASERLQRFAVSSKSAKPTARLDVAFGEALAVSRERGLVVALVVEVGERAGTALVFDALLRQLAAFDGVEAIRAAGGRLFAWVRSKPFEIVARTS